MFNHSQLVPGIIGCLQALEAIKIATGINSKLLASQPLDLITFVDTLFLNIHAIDRQ
jgi:molybdopterin/thiamine biosynthesis adenylyltransferase